MRDYSIVVLSKNLSNLEACYTAIRKSGSVAPVVMVLDDDEDQGAIAGGRWLFSPTENTQIKFGARPFCFARSVNLGARVLPDHDLVLLNDDALIETRAGFELLAQHAYSGPHKWGLMAPLVRGATCNPDQKVAARELIEPDPYARPFETQSHMIPFVCVYIRREVYDHVGPLEERFCGSVHTDGSLVEEGELGLPVYGGEDDDYCLRIRKAGLKLGILDSVVVEHESLPSTFRPGPTRSAPVAGARAVFRRIHGHDPGEDPEFLNRGNR